MEGYQSDLCRAPFKPTPPNLHHVPQKTGIITPVLQMRRLRPREPKTVTQAHGAGLLVSPPTSLQSLTS